MVVEKYKAIHLKYWLPKDLLKTFSTRVIAKAATRKMGFNRSILGSRSNMVVHKSLLFIFVLAAMLKKAGALKS